MKQTAPALIAVWLTLMPYPLPAMQTAAASQFCGTTVPAGVPPRLQLRDEASLRPDFVRFRADLQRAAAARDVRAVLATVHPNARAGFDGAAGPEAFRERHIDNLEEDFWQEFSWILRMGGRFRAPAAFDAPYVFSSWPEPFDAFECVAVTGTRVRLRESPGLAGKVIRLLTFEIVEQRADQPSSAEWRHVRTADGASGYIASQYVRSPVDHRASFEFLDGRWWLVSYVAGD